jgi:hypothetical protein
MNAPAIRTFARHYVEMIVAMFAGMLILGLPGEAALGLAGTSSHELQTTAPAVVLLGMAFTMTVPMVGWMRFRGHGWRPSVEMAASMVLPTLGAIAAMGAGITDFDGAMVAEHVAMFPAMLVAMLLRVDEYTGHAHHGAPREAIA